MGHCGIRPTTDTAVVILHNDRVYIFSTDADSAGEPAAKAALAAALQSISWPQ